MMLQHGRRTHVNGCRVQMKRHAPKIEEPPFLSGREEKRLNSALLNAATAGDCKQITELLKKGARRDARNDTFGSTPLACAATEGKTDAVKTMLDDAKRFYSDHPTAFSALLELKDRSGWTALQWARVETHMDCVAILKEYGAKG